MATSTRGSRGRTWVSASIGLGFYSNLKKDIDRALTVQTWDTSKKENVDRMIELLKILFNPSGVVYSGKAPLWISNRLSFCANRIFSLKVRPHSLLINFTGKWCL